MAQELLEPFDLTGKLILADRGYDSAKFIRWVEERGGIVVIPSRVNAKCPGNIGFWRNCVMAVLLLNVVQNFFCSVRFIYQNGTVGNINMSQNIHSHAAILYIPTCQLNVNWIAWAICNRMDFRHFPAPTGANKLVILAVYSPF